MNEIATISFNRTFVSRFLKLSYSSLSRALCKPIESSPNIQNYEERNVRQQEKFSQIPKQARMKLQSVLEIREIDTMTILLSDAKLLTASLELMKKNKALCEENDISLRTIINYPFLLYDSDLCKKFEFLKLLPFDTKCSIPLTKLSLPAFSNIVESPQCVQRIQALTKLFNIDTENACDLIARRTFLFTKPVEELEIILGILHAQGFSNEEILNDLWILKYSLSFVENRVEFLKKANFKKLKTWMIRCPEEVLYKHIKRETDNRDILGQNSVAQYLSKKLCCSENLAQNLIIRQPQLKKKSLSKITNMINLLYEHGYTPKQICNVPKILHHSRKTIEMRLKQLEVLGEKPDSLYVLTKSQKQYQLHIENLVDIINNNVDEC